MGGGFALLLVADHGFAVASTNYGGLPKRFDSFVGRACPVVGSYGAKDRSLRGTAAKLEGALTAAGVPHDVKEYAEAGHSFLNDHDPSELNALVVLLASDLQQPLSRPVSDRCPAAHSRLLRRAPPFGP